MRTHSEGEVVRLKKSISYWSFVGKSCVEAMRIAKDAGFEGIELAMDGAGDLTPQTTPAQLAQLKSAAEEIGIQLPSVASGLYWEHSFTSDDADCLLYTSSISVVVCVPSTPRPMEMPLLSSAPRVMSGRW